MTRIVVMIDGEVCHGKILSLSEVKTRLPELVAGVQEREEEVIVTKNGRPAAILINVDEYTRLKETVDVLSDPGLMSQIAESRAFTKRNTKGSRLKTCSANPSRPSRSVARRDAIQTGHPSACRRGDPYTPSRSEATDQVSHSCHCRESQMR